MARKRGNMRAIKQQIQTGTYRVDSHLVADALIRRMGQLGGFPLGAWDQNECSKPASSPSASRKNAPGGPSATDPIQVSPSFAPKHC